MPAHRNRGRSLTGRRGPYRAPLPRTRTSTDQGIASLGPYAAEVRSSGCMSFLRHALRACPGDSSRQPRPWRAARAIGSCTTGWVSTMGARFGFAKNFGFRPTGSRPSRVADLALGDYETALVLSACTRRHIGAQPDQRQTGPPARPDRLRNPGRAHRVPVWDKCGHPRSGDLCARRFLKVWPSEIRRPCARRFLKRPERCDSHSRSGSGEQDEFWTWGGKRVRRPGHPRRFPGVEVGAGSS